MMVLDTWQWAMAAAAAVIVGISKAGIGGLGMLAVVIFAQIMPAKQATGIVLPLLCFGDIVGATVYWRHADWRHLWRLFPWTAAGVVIGYFALDVIPILEKQRGHYHHLVETSKINFIGWLVLIIGMLFCRMTSDFS